MSALTRNAVLSALTVSATASAVSALVIVMATPEPQVKVRVRPQSTVTDTVKIPMAAPTVTVTATATKTVRASRSQERPVRTQRPAAVNGSPRSIARSMVSASQWPCLDAIVRRESGWSVTATNPSSGAYGLVQALPGSKMASAGSDWRTNPATQLRWGIRYMEARYGSPCGALAFHKAHGWY